MEIRFCRLLEIQKRFRELYCHPNYSTIASLESENFRKKNASRKKTKQSKTKQNKTKQNKTKHRTRCFDIFVEHSSLVTKFCITIYIEFHNAQQFQQYFTECPLILQFDVDEHARNTLYTP